MAISAPYEEKGVVYIYYGSSKGLTLQYRLVGSQFVPSIARFGHTISRGADYDNNGYNGKTEKPYIFNINKIVDICYEYKL